MVMHIGENLAGAGTAFFAEPDVPLPLPQPAGPDPANEAPPPEPDAPSTWLQDLPPPNLHPSIGHTEPDWGVPLTQSALLSLAPAAVTVPAPSAPPIVQVAPAGHEPAPPGPVETPVSPESLQQREAALLALRADYASARDAALASQGSGPGWGPAAMTTDDSGRPISANGAPIVFVADPLAEPPANWNPEDGPPPPAGLYLEFSEDAFAAQFLADVAGKGEDENQDNGNLAWKTLANLYETDAATLATRHPELLDLALTEHAINDGPPPPGHAMGSVQQLGITDLVLADPLMREIAQTFGRTPDAPTSALAREQVRFYGQARYEQMTRLHIGMESVRDQYSTALDQASQAADGPGWVDVQVQRLETTSSVQGDGDVFETRSVTVTERRFDPDAFTSWYNAQDGLANRAFAQLYGNSHTEYAAPVRRHGEDIAQAGPPTVGRITFDNAPWHISGLGNPMRRDGLIGLDLNTAPRMNNNAAVGFDFEVGWATSPDNIYDRPSTGQQLAQLAVVVAVSYFTYGAASTWAGATVASGGLGLGAVGTAVVAGATAAAASSLANGVMNGHVDLKDIVRSAFSAALMAGLMGGAGQLGMLSTAGRVGETLVRMTVQGGLQALMGGEFRDGAAMAFASGLAQAVGDHLNTAIARSLPADQVSAAQSVVRVVTSAIRALGNPDDPLSAFASGLLNDVLQDSGLAPGGQTATQAAGTTGSVSTPPMASSAALEAVAMANELINLGYEPDAAAAEAMRRIGLAPGGPNVVAGSTPTTGSGLGSSQVGHEGTIVIEGTPPLRDAFGNFYQQGPDGQRTVYLAQGGMLMLGASQTVSIVDGLAVPNWQVLRQLGEVALRAPALAVSAVLAGMPSNVGQGTQVWQLNANTRLERAPGAVWATMQEQTPGGDWRPVMVAQTRPDGTETLVVDRFWVESTGAGFFGLSETEMQRLRPQINTPALQPQGPNVMPLPAWAEPHEVLPPFASAAPTPRVPGLEAAPQPSADDLIIQRDQDEQRRFRGRVIGEAFGLDPNFDPSLYDAHHVVPLTQYPDLQPLRDRFALWEIDLNDLANGVPLPRVAGVGEGTPHRETQNNRDYEESLQQRFASVETREEALDVLAQIKSELRAGTFFLQQRGN